jgi:hypothetical protein
MRTITTKVYTFDELGEEAKKKALEWWAANYEMLDGDKVVNSIKEFVDLFNGKLKDWSFDWSGGQSSWKVDLSDEVKGLSGVRLYKWISNNNVPLKGDCPLTGMCLDEALLDEVRKFMKAPREEVITKDLINWAIQNLLLVVENEYQYQAYGEGAVESILANGYEFTEDGELV